MSILVPPDANSERSRAFSVNRKLRDLDADAGFLFERRRLLGIEDLSGATRASRKGAKTGEQSLIFARQRIAHPVEITWPQAGCLGHDFLRWSNVTNVPPH